MAIHRYALTMPIPETHTPHRMVRISNAHWKLFGQLVGDRNRSKVIKEFVMWYVGDPDGKMPRRPKPVDNGDSH
jgi:hypothetical protein